MKISVLYSINVESEYDSFLQRFPPENTYCIKQPFYSLLKRTIAKDQGQHFQHMLSTECRLQNLEKKNKKPKDLNDKLHS